MTLIELLVAVVIMGIAFVIIVGGIGTAIIGSDIQKQKAGADVVLRSAAEAIVYVPCPATYPAPPDRSGFTFTVTRVSFWDPIMNRFVTGPPCLATGLHLIELTASSTSGRQTTETLEVVKRRP